jgi:LPXTG-motif cell wall-anchored protein
MTATVTVDSDGNTHAEVTIPPGTPCGVYYLFIVGTDPNGVRRVQIVPVTVGCTGATAGKSGDKTSGGAATADAVAVPPEVAALVSSMTPAEAEDAADAVLNHGAHLKITANGLQVLPRTGSDSTRPLVAAGAVSIVGGTLLLARRRQLGIKAVVK